MQDINLLIDFLFLNLKNIALMYSTYLILGFSFTLFIIDRFFVIYHKIKNHN